MKKNRRKVEVAQGEKGGRPEEEEISENSNAYTSVFRIISISTRFQSSEHRLDTHSLSTVVAGAVGISSSENYIRDY